MPIVYLRMIRITKVATAAPSNGGEHAVHLDRNLSEVAFEQAGLAAPRFSGEHTRKDGADDAADAVNTEDVEAVVIAQHLLQASRGDVAADAGSRADDKRALGIDEAASRRDGDETSNGTGGDAKQARLTVDEPLGEHPSERGHGGGDLRRGHGDTGAVLPAASAEPALKPNQPTHSSEAPMSVQDEVEGRHALGAVAGATSEDEAGDETGDAGVDVNDRAAGEVENAVTSQGSRRPTPNGRPGCRR